MSVNVCTRVQTWTWITMNAEWKLYYLSYYRHCSAARIRYLNMKIQPQQECQEKECWQLKKTKKVVNHNSSHRTSSPFILYVFFSNKLYHIIFPTFLNFFLYIILFSPKNWYEKVSPNMPWKWKGMFGKAVGHPHLGSKNRDWDEESCHLDLYERVQFPRTVRKQWMNNQVLHQKCCESMVNTGICSSRRSKIKMIS